MSEIFSNIVRSNDRAAPRAALHVEVIADLACPFCFIGKRRLDDAMQAVRGPSDISWYPYQLNPDMPAEGLSLEAYLTLRFGDAARVRPALERLAAEGREQGIDFRFDRLQRVPNTLPAHQVMYLAEMEGRNQTALADELMSAFFLDGADISDTDVLIERAARHDLGPRSILRVIGDHNARQVVLNREAQVRASGIAGVPGFLLNRRLLLIGAQSTETMVNAFDRAMFGEGNDSVVSPALH